MNSAPFMIILQFIGMSFYTHGCTTQTITFVSNEKANVSLVAFDDPAGEGDLIGETPRTIPVSELGSKYVRIWGETVLPQYWIVSPLTNEKNEVSVRLEYKPEPPPEADASGSKVNRYFRILMRSYQALTAKQWETARDLAKQLSREVPDAAAPHVISGLSYLGEQKKSRARSSFLKAKNLDPEDLDIDQLLKYTK